MGEPVVPSPHSLVTKLDLDPGHIRQFGFFLRPDSELSRRSAPCLPLPLALGSSPGLNRDLPSYIRAKLIVSLLPQGLHLAAFF